MNVLEVFLRINEILATDDWSYKELDMLLKLQSDVANSLSKEKEWCSWTLYEYQLRDVAEDMGYRFNEFTEEQKNRIANEFESWLRHSEEGFWVEWLQHSITEVMGDECYEGE